MMVGSRSLKPLRRFSKIITKPSYAERSRKISFHWLCFSMSMLFIISKALAS